MPTTTNYGFTTPADTDLVKDGASAIRTLGNGIDSMMLAQSLTLPRRTGVIYKPQGNFVQNNTLVPNTNTTYYIPFVVPKTFTADRLTIRTATSFSGTATVRMGIYNNNATTGLPDTVLLDAGTVSATAASTDYSITISQSLTPGIYWIAGNCQSAATTNTYIGFNGSSNVTGTILDLGLQTTTGGSYAGYLQSSVTGAFATAGTLTANTNMLGLWYRSA